MSAAHGVANLPSASGTTGLIGTHRGCNMLYRGIISVSLANFVTAPALELFGQAGSPVCNLSFSCETSQFKQNLCYYYYYFLSKLCLSVDGTLAVQHRSLCTICLCMHGLREPIPSPWLFAVPARAAPLGVTSCSAN